MLDAKHKTRPDAADSVEIAVFCSESSGIMGFVLLYAFEQ